MYDFLWLWSKKVHFLWLFMAIKFELSLVITFMAFYDEPCTYVSHYIERFISNNIKICLHPENFIENGIRLM